MAFVALKPVRFDKEYAVGDVIPESVVDLKRRKVLSDKIIEVPDTVADLKQPKILSDKIIEIPDTVVDLEQPKILSDKIIEVPENVVSGLVEEGKLKKVEGTKEKKTSKKKKVKKSTEEMGNEDLGSEVDGQEKVPSLELAPEGTESRFDTQESGEDLGEGGGD